MSGENEVSFDGMNMKITVDLPEDELQEVMRHTGAKTKREALVVALSELNRRRRLKKLIESFGTLDFMSQEDLRRMRGDAVERPEEP
jgi:Arc/MetJ family transcription regulator